MKDILDNYRIIKDPVDGKEKLYRDVGSDCEHCMCYCSDGTCNGGSFICAFTVVNDPEEEKEVRQAWLNAGLDENGRKS